MAFVMALDQGTTSSRAIVFDTNSAIRGFAQKEFTQYFPQPGWVEHDGEEIWTTQLETARAAIKNAGIAVRDVAAIGVTNQRETTVVWDRKTGEAVHRAIVWQDRRTADICSRLRTDNRCDDLIRHQTGLVLDPYFSASKLVWLFENVKGLRERAERGELAFGTVDSWLVWKLTGGRRHVTDYTNASRTLLFDIEKLRWSDEILQRLGIPRSILPEALPCTAEFGTCRADLLGAEIPVTGIAGDQQAALVGQACFAPGMAKNTYGTGAFLIFNTGDRIVRNREGMLATVAYAFNKNQAAYALEGSVFVAGAAVQWLRDGLGLIRTSADVEQLAASVPDSAGVFFVPAFTGLGAPHWDPHARGTILGITRGSTAAHLARAALEAMAYQSAEVVALIERASGAHIRELRVDGGAAANNLAMQFQADLLGVDVVRPAVIETTALGAAYLAGLQAGCWRDIEAISNAWKEEHRFRPGSDEQQRRSRMEQWMRAVERAQHWAQDQPESKS